jgi:HAD superfamily hydrolase (TIGR01509 family)
MDGLMIDSERLYFQAEGEMAKKFCVALKEETLWKMMGTKPIEGLAIFVKDLGLPITAQEALDMRNNVMRKKLQTELEAMPGLFHILETFFNRLKLAVCTGAQEEFLNIVVNQLKIRDKFDVLQSSDGIEKGKPEPEIYLKTCEKLSVPPRECLVLEDSANGVSSGKKAGCRVIAIPSEYTLSQDFTSADFIATDLLEAENHIQKLLQLI